MAKLLALAPNDSRNREDHAYHAVREKILRGSLELGAPVSSRSLAGELGMSHLPVAQALRRLESEGFLESRPRAGTRVKIPTARDIEERYEIREALESQSARLFARKATPAERRETVRMAEQLDAMFAQAAVGTPDPEFLFAVHSFHFDLHVKIAQYSGCKPLRELIERNHILTFNWFFDVAAQRQALPPQFHAKLLETLAAGSPEKADRAMRAHINYGRTETVNRIQHEAPTEWRGKRAASAE